MPALAASRGLSSGLEVRVITSTKYCSQLANFKLAAFRTNALNSQMYPLKSNPNGVAAWLEEREHQDLNDAELATIAVVETQSDSIVARAKCRIPKQLKDLTNERIAAKPRDLNSSSIAPSHSRGLPQPPEGCDRPLLDAFQSAMRQQRLNHYNAKEDHFLGALYTLPTYQGRGCASALLNWCITAADARNARVYLESTPDAHSLYQKAGWEDVDCSTIDLSEFGGTGLYHLVAMIRQRKDAT